MADCDLQMTQANHYTLDGAPSSNAVQDTSAYLYDSYGRVTKETDTANGGGPTGSPTTIVKQPTYVWNDAVTASSTAATGIYLIDVPSFTDIEDAGGNRSSCRYSSYDGQANVSGQSTGLLRADLTQADRYSFCGTPANGFNDRSGPITTTQGYDSFGYQQTTNDPDANAGNPAHRGCTVGSGTYSLCTVFDATFLTLGDLADQCAESDDPYHLPTAGLGNRGWRLRALADL